MGGISLKAHRPIEGTPKTVTIRREADGWYACSCCADVPVQPLPATGQETGIDMRLESCAALANGQRIFTPSYYRKAEASLRRCARRIARRHKGSQRRAKAVKLLAKAHQHVANQRRDFHHRQAAQLVRAYDRIAYDRIAYDRIAYDRIAYDRIAYDRIAYEDLQAANMGKHHYLAKSISAKSSSAKSSSDAGWSQFLNILTSKAASAGKRVVAVPPAYTSQRWSGCGILVQKGLSVRWHACPDCGVSLHRDHNAARNMLRLAQQQRSRPG
jgi:putative transposase